jgi:hypothetical protein
MQLDLVDGGHDAGGVDDHVEVLGFEIAHSDRADPALVAKVGEGLEGLDELVLGRQRPMDEVQVEIVLEEELTTQPVHAGVECPQRAVVALIGVPEFGDQVQFVSRHAGLGKRSAGLAFIAVGRRGVDVSVTRSQRSTHGLLGVRGFDLENTEADGGNGIAVVQRDQGSSHDKKSARRT